MGLKRGITDDPTRCRAIADLWRVSPRRRPLRSNRLRPRELLRLLRYLDAASHVGDRLSSDGLAPVATRHGAPSAARRVGTLVIHALGRVAALDRERTTISSDS